jgi:hypothetical protein
MRDAIGASLCQDARVEGVVVLPVAGPGSDLSEEPVVGVELAALDCRVAPACPPGSVAIRASRRICG